MVKKIYQGIVGKKLSVQELGKILGSEWRTLHDQVEGEDASAKQELKFRREEVRLLYLYIKNTCAQDTQVEFFGKDNLAVDARIYHGNGSEESVQITLALDSQSHEFQKKALSDKLYINLCNSYAEIVSKPGTKRREKKVEYERIKKDLIDLNNEGFINPKMISGADIMAKQSQLVVESIERKIRKNSSDDQKEVTLLVFYCVDGSAVPDEKFGLDHIEKLKIFCQSKFSEISKFFNRIVIMHGENIYWKNGECPVSEIFPISGFGQAAVA